MQVSLDLLDDADGLNLVGSQRISVTASAGGGLRSVSILIDGRIVAQSSTSPFIWSWDTTKVTDGTHQIQVAAQYKTRTAKSSIAVTVKNTVPVPTPTPTPVPTGKKMSDYTGLCLTDPNDILKAKNLTGNTRIRTDWYMATNPNHIAAAKAASIEVLPIACYSMGLSSSGDHFFPDAANVDKWCSIVAAAVVANGWRKVEIWNEPWLAAFAGPGPDPVAYLALVKAAAKAIWAVAPDTIILVSGDTLGSDYYLWRKNLLAADTTGFLCDPRIRPTSHDYCQSRTPTTIVANPDWWDFDRYEYAYKDFKDHGHPDPQIHVTEDGWGTGPDQDNVGETNQAAYYKTGIEMMYNSNHVEAAYWFYFGTGGTWSYNMLRTDGTPKPVCNTVKTLITA